MSDASSFKWRHFEADIILGLEQQWNNYGKLSIIVPLLLKGLVDAILERFQNETLTIIDLGCGNGALLQKICERRSGWVPYGVDQSAEKIAHAREILPAFGDNFHCADFFADLAWAEHRYDLALLMPGRLLEVPPERAAAVLMATTRSCRELMLYTYPDRSREGVRALARRVGLESPTIGEGSLAFVKLSAAR